jgi:hypothetical protein
MTSFDRVCEFVRKKADSAYTVISNSEEYKHLYTYECRRNHSYVRKLEMLDSIMFTVILMCLLGSTNAASIFIPTGEVIPTTSSPLKTLHKVKTLSVNNVLSTGPTNITAWIPTYNKTTYSDVLTRQFYNSSAGWDIFNIIIHYTRHEENDYYTHPVSYQPEGTVEYMDDNVSTSYIGPSVIIHYILLCASWAVLPIAVCVSICKYYGKVIFLNR